MNEKIRHKKWWQFDDLSENSARFLKCVWPYWGIMHLMVKIHLQLLVPLLPSFDISERSIQQVPITSSFVTSLKDFKNKRKKYIYGIENSSSDNILKFEGKPRCWNLILGCSLFISTKLILWLKFSKNFRKIQLFFFLSQLHSENYFQISIL